MTQFPGRSHRKAAEAGHFLALPPTLGIPRLLGAGRGLASRRLQAGGGWRGAVYAGRAGPESQPRACLACRAAPLGSERAPRPVTSRGPRGGGAGAPGHCCGGWGGEFRGRAGEPAPPPGKQALPHILHAPRPFPAPSQPGEGPRATPLPALRQAEPAPLQEVGAEPRPR